MLPNRVRIKTHLITVCVILTLTGLAFAYTYPGSRAMVENSLDQVLSDDTDIAPLPTAYDAMLQVWQQDPWDLIYGAVYVRPPNPEHGTAHWFPWIERVAVIALSYVVSLEHLSTAFIVFLLILNGVAMYALGRNLKWTPSVSLALGIAWAFCAYTRGRMKVHPALTGTFHLPMIFLALWLVARGKGWRSLLMASALMLVAASTAHYLVVTSAFLLPFLLLFFFICTLAAPDQNWRRLSARLMAMFLPAALLLGLGRAFPVPPDADLSSQAALPKSGLAPPQHQYHPFLSIYAARPVDFVSGDVSLGTADLNPLRSQISTYVLTHLENSNSHERANGIRWIIWALGLAMVVSALCPARRPNTRFPEAAPLDVQDPHEWETRRLARFFLVFGIFGFALSLPPLAEAPWISPSYWLHLLVSQIRVPSRAGILVHFSLLMLTGLYLSRPRSSLLVRILRFPAVLPLLMVLELPPLLQSPPMAPLRPRVEALQRTRGPCGTGMYFPFVSSDWYGGTLYHAVQRLRGTDCLMLNLMSSEEDLRTLLQRFPLNPQTLQRIDKNDALLEADLRRIIRCVPLTWIVFDDHTPLLWRERFCRSLGWSINPDLSCVAPDQTPPFRNHPARCL
ncbi:MAG: hypothetical protein AB7G93_16635 [Bdellovibrionales bacterium]